MESASAEIEIACKGFIGKSQFSFAHIGMVGTQIRYSTEVGLIAALQ